MIHIFRVQSILKSELKELYSLKSLLSQEIRHSDKGTLVKIRRNGHVYLARQVKSGGKTYREYLGLPDSEKARRFKKGLYDRKQLEIIEQDIVLLERWLGEYENYGPAAVLRQLPVDGFQFPEDIYLDERYEEMKRWANDESYRNPAPFPEAEHYLSDRRRVRSKGEALLLNMLIAAGIPVRPDSELEILDENNQSKIVYPDGQIPCYDGSIILVEHLGLLEKTSYALEFGIKSRGYLQKGFVINKNYFITSDDKYGGTDTSIMRQVVEQIASRVFSRVPLDPGLGHGALWDM